MTTGARYDIAELARLTGLSVRTIRYYIQQRLLHPSGARGPGSGYDAGHLARLRLIRRLQAEHLPLAEIRSRLTSGEVVLPSRSSPGRDRHPPAGASVERAERSHWERIPLAPDVELHVRRPLSRVESRSVDRLIEEARRILRAPEGPRLSTEVRRIVLLPEPGLRGLADAVVPRLSAADALLFAALDVGEEVTVAPGEILGLEAEAALAREAARLAPEAEVRIVLTRRRLADNWFSHWHAGPRAAVVSLADWESAFQVSPLAFVAYEIAHHGLRALAPDFDPVPLAHEDTRGCLFDFCATRADIEVKLQAADLCPSCRSALETAGLPLDRLLHLAETLRSLATDPPSVVQ